MTDGTLPVLCSGPPRSGLNLLSILLDDHPDIFSGPPLNLFGHAALWRGDGTFDAETAFDVKAAPFCCPLWGPPSSRALAYHFTAPGDVRHVLKSGGDGAEVVELI